MGLLDYYGALGGMVGGGPIDPAGQSGYQQQQAPMMPYQVQQIAAQHAAYYGLPSGRFDIRPRKKVESRTLSVTEIGKNQVQTAVEAVRTASG